MSQSNTNSAPTRQMSSRRSKPSMELLVDNQRVLTQYIISKISKPDKKVYYETDNTEISSNSENVILPKNVKSPPKGRIIKRKFKPVREKKCVQIVDDNNRVNTLKINGSKKECKSEDENHNISSVPYVTVNLKKIEITDSTDHNKIKIDSNCDANNIHLSKVPLESKSPNTLLDADNRPRISLPPKKKIQFINISDLKHISPNKIIVTNTTPISNNNVLKSSPNINISSPVKVGKRNRIVNTTDSPSQDDQKNPRDKLAHVVIEPTKLLPVKETPRKCIRKLCTNFAIDDIRWDKEYCSPECVVTHSKQYFNEWLFQKREPLEIII